jgi:hypothetical protein
MGIEILFYLIVFLFLLYVVYEWSCRWTEAGGCVPEDVLHIQWNLGSRTNFPKKKSGVMNGVSSNEHTSRQATTVGDKLGVSAGKHQLLCNFHSVHIVSVYEHFR